MMNLNQTNQLSLCLQPWYNKERHMSKGFVALVTTDSCDHYTWFYDEKPTRADII